MIQPRGGDPEEEEIDGGGAPGAAGAPDPQAISGLAADHRTKSAVLRAEICQAFAREAVVKTDEDSEEMRNGLFELVSQDPYLSEMVTSPEVCATIGRIRYIREVLLALQPSQAAVVQLGEAHKDMIGTVATVARSLFNRGDPSSSHGSSRGQSMA